jgi:hypothetical protein
LILSRWDLQKFAPSLDRVATCTYVPRAPMKSRRALSFTRVLIARQQHRCRTCRVCTQSSSRTSHGCEQDTPRSAVHVQNGDGLFRVPHFEGEEEPTGRARVSSGSSDHQPLKKKPKSRQAKPKVRKSVSSEPAKSANL